MKKISIYFFITLLAITFIECSKSSSSDTPTTIDYATPACGTYIGTLVLTDTVVITKVSDSVVRIKGNFPEPYHVNITAKAKPTADNTGIHLWVSSNVDGAVTGKVLRMNFNDKRFEGVKP